MFNMDVICPSIIGERVQSGCARHKGIDDNIYMNFALKLNDFRIEIRGLGVDIEIEGNVLDRGVCPEVKGIDMGGRGGEGLRGRGVEALRGREVEGLTRCWPLSSIGNVSAADTSVVRLLFGKVTDWSLLDCPYTSALRLSEEWNSVYSIREIIERIPLCDFFRNSSCIERSVGDFPLNSDEVTALRELISACKVSDLHGERKRIIEIYRELKMKRRERILGLRFPKKSMVAKLKKRINGRFVKSHTATASETF